MVVKELAYIVEVQFVGLIYSLLTMTLIHMSLLHLSMQEHVHDTTINSADIRYTQVTCDCLITVYTAVKLHNFQAAF